MAVLNRALHKAYTRRSMTEPAPARAPAPVAASGWAEKLREPIRPVERPVVESPVAEQPVAEQPAVESPVVELPAVELPAAERPVVELPPAEPPVVERFIVAERPAAEPARPVVVPEPALTWSYPAIVDQLLSGSAGNAVRHLAEQLKHLGIARDLRSIAFCGPGRNAGRTSLTLALTKVLTLELATRVTLVDADFAHRDLARAVDLQPATGLWTPTTDPAPAPSVVKRLVPGWLSLVPVINPPPAEFLNGRLIGTIHAFWRMLKQNCDLLLIDAGPWDSPSTPLLIDSRAIDACVGVCRFQTPQGAWPGNEQLRQPGIEWLGIVETFVPPSQLPSSRT